MEININSSQPLTFEFIEPNLLKNDRVKQSIVIKLNNGLGLQELLITLSNLDRKISKFDLGVSNEYVGNYYINENLLPFSVFTQV
jgi:hypothetical protein